MTVDFLFDVDGTLITYRDKPRYEIINLLLSLQNLGFSIGVWSGGGADYAQHVTERLGLEVDWVGAKSHDVVARFLVIDDQPEADFGPAMPVLHVPILPLSF